jgi:hypothetical protein
LPLDDWGGAAVNCVAAAALASKARPMMNCLAGEE